MSKKLPKFEILLLNLIILANHKMLQKKKQAKLNLCWKTLLSNLFMIDFIRNNFPKGQCLPSK